jgi:hypothetical protein
MVRSKLPLFTTAKNNIGIQPEASDKTVGTSKTKLLLSV